MGKKGGLLAYLLPGSRPEQREKIHKANNEAAKQLAELRQSSKRLRRVVERIAEEREKEDGEDTDDDDAR